MRRRRVKLGRGEQSSSFPPSPLAPACARQAYYHQGGGGGYRIAGELGFGEGGGGEGDVCVGFA